MSWSLIVAMDKNGVIGKNNSLPWKLPRDLEHVKTITTGSTIIMGRKNFESIGRPLPNRRNIILTRNRNYSVEGCEVYHSVQEVLDVCHDSEDVFVFGGGEIYRLFLPYVSTMFVTRIHHEFDGDTYFPSINEKEWKLICAQSGILDEKNKYTHVFLIYKRVSHITVK